MWQTRAINTQRVDWNSHPQSTLGAVTAKSSHLPCERSLHLKLKPNGIDRLAFMFSHAISMSVQNIHVNTEHRQWWFLSRRPTKAERRHTHRTHRNQMLWGMWDNIASAFAIVSVHLIVMCEIQPTPRHRCNICWMRCSNWTQICFSACFFLFICLEADFGVCFLYFSFAFWNFSRIYGNCRSRSRSQSRRETQDDEATAWEQCLQGVQWVRHQERRVSAKLF